MIEINHVTNSIGIARYLYHYIIITLLYYISYIHLTEVFNDSRISTVPHLWPKVVEVQILIWFLPPWESYMMQGIDFNRPLGGWKFREASHHWVGLCVYIYNYTYIKIYPKSVYIEKHVYILFFSLDVFRFQPFDFPPPLEAEIISSDLGGFERHQLTSLMLFSLRRHSPYIHSTGK